jgi:xanthine dehydrogenase YagR molybdenum-binding subunit
MRRVFLDIGSQRSPSYADHHVPANADVHAIDVIFVEAKDHEINSLGVKGVGEIGIVGAAMAITLDELMRD